jgi:hypothetical protein
MTANQSLPVHAFLPNAFDTAKPIEAAIRTGPTAELLMDPVRKPKAHAKAIAPPE